MPVLLARFRYRTFDFINIDTEGNVLEILEQIDPSALGCRLMCLEWSSQNMPAFEKYFRRNRMHKLLQDAENLIYGSVSQGPWTSWWKSWQRKCE